MKLFKKIIALTVFLSFLALGFIYAYRKAKKTYISLQDGTQTDHFYQ
jgi:NADH:ubiquinone oxidoreductase subunit 3 (subunit A)